MLKLVVTEPFAGFAKGDEIVNPADIATYLAERRHCVVPVSTDDEPAAKPDKA